MTTNVSVIGRIVQSGFVQRILNEPALVVAVILAVANLIGADWTGQAEFVESILLLLGGIVIRQQVTPTRTL